MRSISAVYGFDSTCSSPASVFDIWNSFRARRIRNHARNGCSVRVLIGTLLSEKASILGSGRHARGYN